LQGIWIGMLFGTFIQTIVLTVITYKTNWEEQVCIWLKASADISKVLAEKENKELIKISTFQPI